MLWRDRILHHGSSRAGSLNNHHKADAVTSRPPIHGPFRVRCDMCGEEYVYKPSEVLKIERQLSEGFVPHPLFCDHAT
jgi:hypothetical protein